MIQQFDQQAGLLVYIHTCPLDVKAKEHIDFHFPIAKVKPFKRASFRRTANHCTVYGRRRTTLCSSSLSFHLIRIFFQRSEQSESQKRVVRERREGDQKLCRAVVGEATSPLKHSHYDAHADPLAQRVSVASLQTLGYVCSLHPPGHLRGLGMGCTHSLCVAERDAQSLCGVAAFSECCKEKSCIWP